MANLNPLELKIVDIKIKKFTGNDEMSIMPQFIELTIFQSIFEPVIKAQMLINDNIGLFVNYPFTGEEVITVYYQSLSDVTNNTQVHKQIQFIIKGVKDIIVNDRARSMVYTIDLTSVEFLQNARKYVSHAYNDLFEDAAEKVYNEYILQDTELQFKQVKNFYKEKSIKVRQVVIPNLRPFQAIQWLAKHAVSADYENKFLYLFYENFDGFYFTTIQQLIKDGQDNIETLIKNQFKYVSDTEVSKINKNDPSQQLRYITNLVNNKRFSSIEKIAAGYYQNELFEISMLQKSYNSTNTELSASSTGQFTLGPNPLNTPE